MKIVKALKTTLSAPLTASASSVVLKKFVDMDGTELAMSDFGDWGVIVVKQGDTVEMIKFSGLSQNSTDTTCTLTVATTGRSIAGTSPYAGASTGVAFNAGAEVIVTNDPLTLSRFANLDVAGTFTAIMTFSAMPATTAGNPVNANDLARKGYVDSVVAGIATTVNVVVPGVAGETVAAGQLIYFDDTDNEWKLCDADTAATVDNALLGIAQGAGTNGVLITNGVLLRGLDANQTGLTASALYYASNTAGGISATAGTVEVTVGFSYSTTQLYFNPRFNQQLTEDQQDALGGSSGTPGNTNKFVTDADTRLLQTDNSRTTGEAIDGSTTPQAVCIVASDGLVYKADANVNTKVSTYGFVTTNASITTTPAIATRGILAGFTGLTIGATYYVSDTAGSIATTPSTTTSIPVGIAISTTQLSIIIGKKIAYGTITHASAAAGTQDVVTTIGFAPSTIILNVSMSVTGSGGFTGSISSIANFFSTLLMSAFGLQYGFGSTSAVTFTKFTTQIKTSLSVTSQKSDFDSAETGTTDWATGALTMNAISATGFTTRITNTTGGGAGGNASGSLKYTAIE